MLEDITFQEWNTKYLLNLIKSVMKTSYEAKTICSLSENYPRRLFTTASDMALFLFKKVLKKFILAILLPVRFQKLYSNILIIFEN